MMMNVSGAEGVGVGVGVGGEILHGTYSSESQSDSPSSSSSCDPSVSLTSSSDSLKVRSVTDVPLNERSVTEVTLTVMSPPLVELTENRETGLKIHNSQKLHVTRRLLIKYYRSRLSSESSYRVTSSIGVRFVSE